MAFPVSLPDDGLIDLAAQSTVSLVSVPLPYHTHHSFQKSFSRADVLASFGGAPRGELYWNDSVSSSLLSFESLRLFQD